MFYKYKKTTRKFVYHNSFILFKKIFFLSSGNLDKLVKIIALRFAFRNNIIFNYNLIFGRRNITKEVYKIKPNKFKKIKLN